MSTIDSGHHVVAVSWRGRFVHATACRCSAAQRAPSLMPVVARRTPRLRAATWRMEDD